MIEISEIENQEAQQTTNALKELQHMNSLHTRSLGDKVSTQVQQIIDSMNIFDNTLITPDILETLIIKNKYSLQATDCERHINKNGEYVHVLSLVNEQGEHQSYIEIRNKPHISLDENELFIKAGNNTLEISKQSIIRKLVQEISKYIYLPNKGNETFRGSWVSSI